MATKTRTRKGARGSPRRIKEKAHSKKPKPSATKGIKLRRLVVKNVKVIDQLTLDFPAPRMKDDPDVFVLGSKNGLGKTSVLESSAMAFIAAAAGKEVFGSADHPRFPVDLFDLVVRAGAPHGEIVGNFVVDGEAVSVTLRLSRKGRTQVTGNTQAFQKVVKTYPPWPDGPVEMAENVLLSLAGMSAEPLLVPPLIYFHSYRKVQEGSPELGAMVEGESMSRRRRYYRRRTPGYPISTFKVEILRSMMGQRYLFEELDVTESRDVLNVLNELLQQYAGGKLGKLRPSPDNTMEFRIEPIGGGPSFSFDGLSSGQKEVISTLFLIWRYTRNQPGIVLIDEPELHLNVEWHGNFIWLLNRLAPQNQYLIATHSEDILASVEPDRRMMLRAEKD